ncbi:MAG: cytochrome o ubiquinol/quinol oxidase subunit IV [Steroidobacteraceae bacterium]
MRHVACESIPYSGVGWAAASFILAQTDLQWPPGVACGLAVLAVAQMGVHLVFFMHIGTDSDHTNNVMALAFGVFIVVLVVAGSLWIMNHLNAGMLSLSAAMQMQRWPTGERGRRPRRPAISSRHYAEVLVDTTVQLARLLLRGVIQAMFRGQPIQRLAGERK